MNPSMDWRINHAITESRTVASVFQSSKFLSGISGSLLKTVDDMLEWFFDHKGHMSYDAQVSYLVKVAKIQADIEFYQRIAEGLWEEESNHA
jgi:hypothetical protein|nr:MAG TPA: hypothetical protein [Caudoviricetes sp.]